MQPDSDHLVEMNGVIQKLEGERNKLLSQLAEVEVALQRNRAERSRSLNRRKPIASLPNELLATIFEYCQMPRQERCGRPSTKITLSHVTSHFRAIAIGTPSLWNNIETSSRPNSKLEHDRVETYLQRSSTCPLDIEILSFTSSGSPLDWFIPHVGRWRRLYLLTERPEMVDALASTLAPLCAPGLESLSFCLDTWPPSQTQLPPHVFVGGAPSLSFVRLSGMAQRTLPPLAHVTILHIESPSLSISLDLNELKAILTLAPSLAHLSLVVPDRISRTWMTDNLSAVSIPNLLSLRIRIEQHVARLLSIITAPRLESLIIHEADPFDPSLTIDFPLLKSLVINDHYWDDAVVDSQVRIMLRFFPHVTHLTLRPSIRQVFVLLGETDEFNGSNAPWPNLHTLSVRFLNSSHESLLHDLFLHRIATGRPIQKLRLDSRSRVVLKRRDHLASLSQVVEIEPCDIAEPWPAGLGFVDRDDIL